MKTPHNSALQRWKQSQISLKRRYSGPLTAWFLLGAAVLAGCAASPPQSAPRIDTNALLTGTALLGSPIDIATLPEDGALTLSPEMRAYLAQISPGAGGDARLQALLRAFLNREFVVEYDAQETLTAEETYRQQKGNCMAFTLMMVAMARALGADASFNQVEVPPVWDHDEARTFVVYRHINMVSENVRGRRVVDFNLAAYDPLYDQRKLSDIEALAQYYSNRGLELMQEGDQENAFRYMRKALDLKPGSADLWANLGALYSRNRLFDLAEQGYQQALVLDSGHAIALSNLERLYRNAQRNELADYYAGRSRYHRERNPYFLYYQARNAYEHGDYRSARKQLKRALWQHENDHRFHFLMGLTSYRLGDYDDSRTHLSQAFSLAENAGTRQAYSRKLDVLRDGK
ncbi:tetratricopeptide repeat protein [Microbulbifer sp.]|uniref:CDC27 family protein n=1 Tax=Microbulbifer sp. TaxID=1908541 RepID=UPI00258E57BD|nr:tetratricopeptide repeat protein [Microbulbifer sp.]